MSRNTWGGSRSHRGTGPSWLSGSSPGPRVPRTRRSQLPAGRPKLVVPHECPRVLTTLLEGPTSLMLRERSSHTGCPAVRNHLHAVPRAQAGRDRGGEGGVPQSTDRLSSWSRPTVHLRPFVKASDDVVGRWSPRRGPGGQGQGQRAGIPCLPSARLPLPWPPAPALGAPAGVQGAADRGARGDGPGGGCEGSCHHPGPGEPCEGLRVSTDEKGLESRTQRKGLGRERRSRACGRDAEVRSSSSVVWFLDGETRVPFRHGERSQETGRSRTWRRENRWDRVPETGHDGLHATTGTCLSRIHDLNPQSHTQGTHWTPGR